MSALRLVALVVTLCGVLACDRREPALFGKPCVDDSECDGDEGFVCDPLRHQCALPRVPEPIPGLTCDDAHTLELRDTGGLFAGSLDVELGPIDEPSPAAAGVTCAGDARWVYARVEVPVAMAARVRANGQGKVTVAVTDGNTCGAALDHACTSGDEELIVPLLDEGTVTIAAAASAGGRIEIVVEQINCPAGFVPTTQNTCLGFLDLPGPLPRTEHALTVVDDDNIAIAGGLDDDGHVISQVFSRRALTWKDLFTGAARDGATAATSGGFLFIVGGSEESGGELLFPNESHLDTYYIPEEALGVRDGTLTFMSIEQPMLFVGGVAPVSAFFFDDSNVCEDRLECPEGFECLGVLEYFEEQPVGRCVCVDGNCNPLLTSELGWADHRVASDLAYRQRHIALDLDDQPDDAIVLVTGGIAGGLGGDPPNPDPAAFVLFSDTLTWVQMPTPAAARRDAVGAAVGRDDVLLVGGRDVDEQPTDLIELWAPLLGTEARVTRMARKRADHAGALVDDATFIAIGGDDGTAGPLATTELIDVRTGIARVGPALPLPLHHAQAVRLDDGSVLVAGGRTADGALVERALLLTSVGPTTIKPDLVEGVAPPEPEGDFCEDAIALAGASGIIEGTTIGYQDDLDTREDFGCSSVTFSPGFDVFYALDVPASATVDFVLEDPISTSDLVLVVYDSCPVEFPCLAGVDNAIANAETLRVTAPAGEGQKTLLVVIDGYLAGTPFNYRLEWTVTPP